MSKRHDGDPPERQEEVIYSGKVKKWRRHEEYGCECAYWVYDVEFEDGVIIEDIEMVPANLDGPFTYEAIKIYDHGVVIKYGLRIQGEKGQLMKPRIEMLWQL